MHIHWNNSRVKHSPCIGCKNFQLCRTKKLVCEVFRFYATGMKTNTVPENYPSRVEYEKVLRG